MKSDLFIDFTNHLLNDDIPSNYFNALLNEGQLNQPPLDMLFKLKHTKQSPQHHPEGDVWNHTMLVIDEAAKIKIKSENPEVFMWAALLHDIGKPSTTKLKKGKITAYNHDKAGAAIAEQFLDELTNDVDFIRAVVSLVRWHMQILYVVKGLPYGEIEAMKADANIDEVALLGLADRLGRPNADKMKEKENIKLFIKKCKY